MAGVKSECGECYLPSKAMCRSRRKQNWNLDTIAAKIRGLNGQSEELCFGSVLYVLAANPACNFTFFLTELFILFGTLLREFSLTFANQFLMLQV